MIHKLILAAVAACFAVTAVQAQDRCVIKGEITGSDSLRFTPVPVRMVYLSKVDEYDRPIQVDSAVVKDKKFQFTREMKAGEPIMLHMIQGFDNGSINLFVEPGEISVKIATAQFPAGAAITGTPNNELQSKFHHIQGKCAAAQVDVIRRLTKEKGDPYMDTPEGVEFMQHVGAAAMLQTYTDMFRFFIEHSDSPFTPLMMKLYLVPVMTPKVNERVLLKLVSPKLAHHPYYRALSNVILAQNMRVGADAPDITLPMADGTEMNLSDLRGKFVLLDFWASWCSPCRREIPNLIQVFEDAKVKDNFALVSFSIDNKEAAWKAAIDSFGINREGWIHASDLLGWSSPTAQMMNVTAVPKTILIDPDGRIVAIDLRGEEMVRNMKRILAGDLYYQQAAAASNGGK